MSCRKIFVSIRFFAVVSVSLATLGWDGDEAVDVDGFNCLKEKGYSFFIGRVGRSVGIPDEVGINNIKNAREAGWEYVDGYIYPCLKSECASAADQVEAAINKVNAEGAEIGMIWMDIEEEGWPEDKGTNQQFIREMVNQAESMNVKVGIYTKYSDWESIVGADWSEMAHLQLWYAHWDKKQNFDGFEAFGGWTTPAIHQFRGDFNGPCGVNMDLNWYP